MYLNDSMSRTRGASGIFMNKEFAKNVIRRRASILWGILIADSLTVTSNKSLTTYNVRLNEWDLKKQTHGWLFTLEQRKQKKKKYLFSPRVVLTTKIYLFKPLFFFLAFNITTLIMSPLKDPTGIKTKACYLNIS